MDALATALSRALGPVVRLAIARGLTYPVLAERLKEVYLSVAERFFRSEGKRLTDSRLSVMTGLQRKDIKGLRARMEDPEPPQAGPLPRIMALWQVEHGGAPLDRARFEALTGSVSRDIHPRTVLDEMERLGLVERAGDEIRLTATAFLPAGDDDALLGYWGANLGDHAMAATENVLAAPDPGPHFERAAHYNRLTPEAVEELDRLSRKLLGEALESLNARALSLQRRDRGKAGATRRFRAGAFVYREGEE